MIEINTAKLTDIMPANLLEDDNVRAAAEAIDTELSKVTHLMKECLLIARIDELSERVVDNLAWQWHVDFYDYSLPIGKKRNLIRKSIGWHRHKGTPYAVKEVVSAILDGAQVLENWEYGGEPYCFKVSLIEGDMAGGDTINKLVKAIKQTKNTRSHLDGVGFVRFIDGTQYFASPIGAHKKLVINIPEFMPPELAGNQYYAVPISVHRKIDIGGN